MRSRASRALGLVLFGLSLVVPGLPAAAQEDGFRTQVRYAMGTLWTIEARGPGVDEAMERAFTEVKRLDGCLSTYRPESELSRVNRGAARGWVGVSAETLALLRRSLSYAEQSGGAFDPTVAPLVRAWGFKYLDYRMPDEAAIARARAKVGYRGVRLDPRRGVRFERPGMELDLGAIAKGYAVDRALAVLRANGAIAARVDAGGNQGVWGPPEVGEAWSFGIKHPREEGEVLGVVPLKAGGVSTSGDAERGFWKDGVRYGHVVDPATGRPVQGRLSVTVVAPTAEEADALSTTLYVLGPERGRAYLANHPGAAALYVLPRSQQGAFAIEKDARFPWLSWGD
ncbi:MAG TPA: FAD:protein FMN transferase [Pantanalinema sp.]